MRTAADESDHRRGVVRSPKRRLANEPAGRQPQAGGRVDHRRLQCLLSVERREQTGEALSQHRLAAAGRTDQEEVVAASGGDLQRAPGHGLTADVAQVGQRRQLGAGIDRLELVPRSGTSQGGNDGGEVGGGTNRGTGGDLSLDGIAERHHDGGVVEGVDHRRDAGHSPDRAVEAELADERVPLDSLEREL